MRILMALLLTVFSMSCGGDSVGVTGEVVGGACVLHQDCAPGSTCLTGGDFPGGTCSVPCDSDLDCPVSSVCIKKDGGYCLLTCDSHLDCRAGYICDVRDREGGGGKALVCIKD